MRDIRIGIIGLGAIGRLHARALQEGRVAGAVLAAVCERGRRPDVADAVRVFTDAEDLCASGSCDAVVVATPHWSHPALATVGFKHGLHVLVEKPAGVHAAVVRAMNAAADRAGTVFHINHTLRHQPLWRTVRRLVDEGAIGEVRRSACVATAWFRPQSYYDAGGWRGTWAGEGGGVLLNQAIHVLDLWQWLCGPPEQVFADCGFGRRHRIEAEDEVTALTRYPGGGTGTFVCSTAEPAGGIRLELIGDRGRIMVDDGAIDLWRTPVPMDRLIAESTDPLAVPPCAHQRLVPAKAVDDPVVEAQRAFVAAIRGLPHAGVNGRVGLGAVELANAMLLSAWSDGWEGLPLDSVRYECELMRRVHPAAAAVATATATS